MKNVIATLEMARELSKENNCPIYVYSNDEKMKVVAKLDWFDEVNERLLREGYTVRCIFEKGKRV